MDGFLPERYVNIFSVTETSISRHLAILKETDLIRDKREGKFIYYELNTSVLEDVMLWITDLKGASDDKGNLSDHQREGGKSLTTC